MKQEHRKLSSLLGLLLIGALILGACDAGSAQETEVEPVAEPDAFVSVVSATGIVVPRQWATLSLPTAGIVAELPVSVGDQVESGSVLVGLSGAEQLEAAVAASRLEWVNASQALDTLIENADVAKAQAEQDLANARDELRDADYTWRVRQEGNRASGDAINAAEANLILAEDEVKKAQKAYNRVSGRRESDPVRALALSNLSAARQHRDSVLRNLNWLTGKPTDLQQALLDADVEVAQANVAEADRRLARLANGPDPRALEAAEMRLANAEAQLRAAETALADLLLRAPFGGTVGELHVRANEWVAPGQPVLLLADLQNMRVETTDLNEIDVAQVSVGDSVTITFDALADLVLTGRVTQIAPKAAEGAGVNFTVIIELDEVPAELRWGMTAFVDIEIGS